jgi:hypothetical protein
MRRGACGLRGGRRSDDILPIPIRIGVLRPPHIWLLISVDPFEPVMLVSEGEGAGQVNWF